MRGNITRRGKDSWRLKFDIESDPVTGERRTQFMTVRGTKKDAERELNKQINQVDEGSFVERSTNTVAEYAKHWLEKIAPAKASAKTCQRYGELINLHIIPQVGKVALQKLDGPRIDSFYDHLGKNGRIDGKGGLSGQTVMHIHRLLSQIMKSAVKAKKLRQSPMEAVQATPKVRSKEIQVLDDDQQAELLKYIRSREIAMPVILATATGMRRGEVLATRWKDIDFERNTLKVAQVLEETKEGIRIKEPKTERGRRTIALPARVVAELRLHRKRQAEMRLRLGLGKDDQDLVFTTFDGEMWSPSRFSKEFATEAAAAGT